LSFPFSQSALAGVIFEMDQKYDGPEELNKITGKVEGNKLRMDFYRNGAEQGSMIYRGDRKEMITIDHQAKTCFVIDKETMDSLAKQMEQAMAQYEEAMKTVPPEHRKMMEEKFKQHMPGDVGGKSNVEPVIKKAGGGKVNGYSCTKYDVYKGAEKVWQHCVTNWGNIEGGGEMQSVMHEMGDFMDQMTKSFAKSSGPLGSSAKFNRSVFNQLHKLDGFPVQALEFENGVVESESTLKSSKETSVDPTDFEPPVGYRKQSMNSR
jgi:hypothetical protein